MADEPEEQATTEPQEDRTRGAGYLSTYVNHADIKVSRWDFRMRFSENRGPKARDMDKPMVEIEEKVELVMSPQHTKALLSLLEENVKSYEEKMGEIHFLPPADEAELERLKQKEDEAMSKRSKAEPGEPEPAD